MRAVKAKVLRFLAYGPRRSRAEHVTNDPTYRSYRRNTKTGQIVNAGQRAKYQALKKQFKAWVRGGRLMQDG